MTIRHLIWDMDGTLFDTYPAINRWMQAAFAALGADVPLAEIAALMTVTFQHCITVVADRYGLDPAAIERRRAAAPRIPLAEQPPFPGVIDVCRAVIAAGGRNVIFTHRGRESLEGFLAHYDMTGLFAGLATVDDGYPRKPDPAGYLALIGRFSLPLAETMAVGDRALDIQAGINAGIKTCYFGPSADSLDGVKPDYAISSYDALPAILGI